MEFLFVWIGSVILTISMEVGNGLTMIKYIADNGYKLNLSKLSKIQYEILPNQSQLKIIKMLIPGYNVVKSLLNASTYANNKDILLTQYSVLGILEEMTELEQKEYLKKPTGLNALKIQARLEQASVLKTNEKDDGKIYFEVNEDTSDITILKTEGEASLLSKEQQEEYIIEKIEEKKQALLIKLIELGIKKYGDMEKLSFAYVKEYIEYQDYYLKLGIEIDQCSELNLTVLSELLEEEIKEITDLKEEVEELEENNMLNFTRKRTKL